MEFFGLKSDLVFAHLDMKAVSGRITLKKTSLATCSVFSTSLVTSVDAYLDIMIHLLGKDDNGNQFLVRCHYAYLLLISA